MLAWIKRLFGKTPTVIGPEGQAALEKSGANQAASKLGAGVASEIGRRDKGNACKKGHPLLVGQRPEDCFDCHLIELMLNERKGLADGPAGAVCVGTLLCLNGFHRGQAYPLMMKEDVPLIIGADPDSDIVLSDERISRKHLSMVRRQSRTTVRDINSLHHSAMRAEGELQWYVLDPEREYWFRDGCHIMLGDIEFLFRATDEAALKMGAAAV